MANKSTRDTGMRQRTVTTYRMDDPKDARGAIRALEEFSNSLPVAEPGDCGGDALRRQNAERCREILATVGIADNGSCAADNITKPGYVRWYVRRRVGGVIYDSEAIKLLKIATA